LILANFHCGILVVSARNVVNLHLELGVVSGYDPPRNNSAATTLDQEFEVAMTVQVPITQWAGIVIYLLAITGISLLGTRLSSVVAEQTIVLALPHLDHGPPKLSLIEQRRIDAARAAQPLPEVARKRVTALEAPAMLPNILAARLDLAEKEDLIEPATPIYAASADDGSLGPTLHPSSIAARVYSYEMTNSSADRPKFRTASSYSRYIALSAADVFNRSFGVLSVAAN
jgi:hypothetical protein